MRFAFWLVLLTAFGCTGEDATLRMVLPKALKEVSGLANYEGDLLAIADERGRIYRISFSNESVERVGAFGDPPVKGDFEGIAVSADTVFAVTSKGVLYSKNLDEPDDAFDSVDTGIGELCEIEGLHWHNQLLYILCKTPYADDLKKHLAIFAWDPRTKQRVTEQDFQLSWRQFELSKEKIHPSGLLVTEDMFFVIAAREKVWLKVNRRTNETTSGRLSSSHDQAEGIAIQDGATYIADEGNKRGTVTRYEGVI